MFCQGPNSIFFDKKKKIEHPEHLLPPTPLRLITSHFCLTSLNHVKVDVNFVSPLMLSKTKDHGS